MEILTGRLIAANWVGLGMRSMTRTRARTFFRNHIANHEATNPAV